MPTALENMVATLKREREQGARDAAVDGGLGNFAARWQKQARQQARRPRHQILIDEIVDSLADYAAIAETDERLRRLNYLLDRATNRLPPPPLYKNRLPEWEAKMKAMQQERGRQRSDRRPPRQQRNNQGRRRPGYDGESWDEDFAQGSSASSLDLPPIPRLSRPPRMPRATLTDNDHAAIQEALDAPTFTVKGIGSKFAELLAQLDLRSVRDLLFSFPRDYRDYTQQQCIQDAQPGDDPATIIATIEQFRSVSSGGREDLILVVNDGTGRLTARFFSQPWQALRMRRGMPVVLHGKITFFRDMKQMANPQWEELDLANLTMVGIVPVYRMTPGLRPRLYRRTLQTLTAEWEDRLPDPLPPALLERADLADFGWAIRQRHFPAGHDHCQHARRRLAFDDLLMLQLALLSARREWQSLPGPQLDISQDDVNEFLTEAFPYKLTGDQLRAVAEIRADMTKPLPMNRLLQGDVGSGKTAVAIAALAMTLRNGMQSAVMAPTGILAEQHYRSISQTFAALEQDDKPRIALLTGALSSDEREGIYAQLADGEIDIVIGTHALIQPGVEFDKLALAIIDEQHRFGVDQRARLRGKGYHPHVLVMSATPFPRSLALTLYADLDLSIISEMPPGRQPVQTDIIEPVARERLHGFVTSQLEAGRQAFFVHPLVEESDTLETASATEAYERLSKVFFRHRVCLLHGRMSAAEKDDIMAAFASHEYDVMVTTTVAEVGVDVPNASVIVIDGANRFGLAQLHQFRGRVGRGEHQSYCFLLPDEAGDFSIERIQQAQAGEVGHDELSNAERRLAALASTTDGFELAQLDMELRGSGSLPGKYQSGVNIFQQAERLSADLIELAQREARTLFEEDPALALPEHQQLAALIESRWQVRGDIS